MPIKKKTKIITNKNYRVILEYLTIRLITDNLDWDNKTIKVNNHTEYLIINIQRLEQKVEKNIKLPDLEISNKSALSHNDIITYWDNLETNFKNNLEIINNLTLNIDYYVVPYYILNDLLILGVVIFNKGSNSNSNRNSNSSNYNVVETFNYMSDIKPKQVVIDDQYKISILEGIINCRINNNGVKTLFSKEILKDKYMHIKNIGIKDMQLKDMQLKDMQLKDMQLKDMQLKDINNIPELSIKWEYIFRNISNYLPKLEIIHKNNNKNNTITNFFQNRLNP